MHAPQTETRMVTPTTSLSWDIAKQMSGRLEFGQVVVVSKQPAALLASTRKQWLKLIRQAEKQRASTTDASKIAAYTARITRLQQAEFAAKSPLEDMHSNILFATAAELLEFAPVCPTMYVATPTDRETLHKITSFMPESGVVVIYQIDNRR